MVMPAPGRSRLMFGPSPARRAQRSLPTSCHLL